MGPAIDPESAAGVIHASEFDFTVKSCTSVRHLFLVVAACTFCVTAISPRMNTGVLAQPSTSTLRVARTQLTSR